MKRIRVLAMLLLLAFAIFIPPKTVNGQLSETKTVSWDINGDGKKDRVAFVPSSLNYDDAFTKMSIYVNGKLAYSCTGKNEYFYEYSYKTINLKNKAKYVFLNLIEENDDSEGYLLRYKNGKFTKEYTLNKSIGKLGFHFYSDVRKVEGNKVYFTASSMSVGLAQMNYEVIYKFKNGKLRVAPKTHKVVDFPLEKDGL